MNYINRRVTVKKKLKNNTWDGDNPIVLKYIRGIKVNRGIGKSVDTFEFTAHNPDNLLFEQYFSGNGSSTDFTLTYAPSSVYLADLADKPLIFQIYVGSVLKVYGTDYTVSGSVISFTSAPASGNRNIKVNFEVISADDLIDIYIYKNTNSYSNSDLLIEGVVSEPSSDSGQNSKFVSVRGKGLIEAVMSALVFIDTKGPKKVHRIIQDVIDAINGYNTGARKLRGGKGTGKVDSEWVAVENPILKSDELTAFPDISYSSNYKSALEIIEELSSNEYTQDGQYIFWVQYNPTLNTYDFYWRPQSTNTAVTIEQGNSDTYVPIITQAGRRVDDIINFIIYNVGPNTDDIGEEYLAEDMSSVASVGGRWLYYTGTSNIAPELIQNEFKMHKTAFDVDDNDKRTSNYPLLSGGTWGNGSATWTFQFNARDTTGSSTGILATCTNTQKAYKETIDNEARWSGKEKCIDIMKLYSKPRIEGESSLIFTNATDIALGNIAELTFSGFGLTNQQLRINEIEYDFWKTHLKLKEDDKTIKMGAS